MHNRSRTLYVFFAILTGTLGLFSRSNIIPMPNFVLSYVGDTLWALMVFWLFCFLFNQHETWKVLLYAILFSFLIEFSQLYHAPWIDEIRQMKLGGLILGYVFMLEDLICYVTGIFIGVIIDYALVSPKIRSEIRLYKRDLNEL